MDISAVKASEEVPVVHRQRAKPQRPRKPDYNYIHRNLLPIETHPIPVLIPHNPVSLIAIALSYLTFLISPPAPQPIYKAYFSSTTSSIHVTDQASIRALWEKGFFGKGNLSRSEPTWMESQRKKGDTSEEHTNKRRLERKELKLERAKKEQEVIEQKLREEAGASTSAMRINTKDLDGIASVLESGSATPDGPRRGNGSPLGLDKWKKATEANGLITPPLTSASSETSLPDTRMARRDTCVKSVRFSPTIEAREFDLTSPIISPIKSPGPTSIPQKGIEQSSVTENEEHLCLSQEEAFFLVYGLGILKVYADDSDTVLPATSLLSLFRRHSYSPSRSLSIPAEPDDPFLLSYVSYHHYRSLGWVVRSGVKFSVSFLLYNRGPAFSHAEFAVVVLPAYTHSYWSEAGESKTAVQSKTQKTWWWLHCVNRVQSQVKKNLIFCYVDIPPPLEEHEKSAHDDIGLLLSRYKVRDVSIKRWIPNRSRD